MATFNSHASRSACLKLVSATLFLLTVFPLVAGEDQRKNFAERAESEFHQAQKQFQSEANNATNAWWFARACYNFADFAKNDTDRADIANQGIAACRQSIAHNSVSAPAHYYLGMNLGQLARTELLGALSLVKEMEREFKTAADEDRLFDFAGPERSLGLLYRDAPGWPTSIGSKRKAREFLELSVKLTPDFPENHLNLIESYLQWHDSENARTELSALDALWPKAQTNFTGEAREQDWDDWSTRRADVRKKLEATPAPAKSPHSGQ
jgi:hypothetical protein